MSFLINNQKPATLSPSYSCSPSGNMEIDKYIKSAVIEPLFQPISSNHPVSITENGNDITEDDVLSMIYACSGNSVAPTEESRIRDFFGNTMLYYNKNNNMLMNDVFTIQAATKEKMDFPTPVIVYTAGTDIIPVSKKFIAGQCSYEELFATFAFYTRSKTLGVYFSQESAFDDFKNVFSQYTQAIAPSLTTDTMSLCTDFNKLTLNGLTESILLRNNDTENCEEYSFARIIMSFIMSYGSKVSPTEFGIMPFDVGELICPKSIVFINIERHAKSSAQAIKKEWDLINKSIEQPCPVVSNKKLRSLTGVMRNLQKIQSNAAMAAVFGRDMAFAKAAQIRFKKTNPTTIDLTRIIGKLLKKMEFVNRSENAHKYVKSTFAKPNRRDPDDFNKMGKLMATKYKPDIHLYIDTSGSISERNYQDAVKACIKMAKKMNVNLYFNSFSSVLSQCTKLHTKDKTLAQIYSEFAKVPKVTGGTSFDLVWRYINESKKRQKELSILMTDFEWYAPNKYIKHPDNLYYIPVSNTDWKSIVHYAESFVRSMKHIDPECRYKILF